MDIYLRPVSGTDVYLYDPTQPDAPAVVPSGGVRRRPIPPEYLAAFDGDEEELVLALASRRLS